MSQQIYIGNFKFGLVEDRLPFNIDNSAFPMMFNMYSWRGRAKKKRGTVFVGQLQFQIDSTTGGEAWQYRKIGTTDGSGDLSVNLVTRFSLQASSSFTPGSFSITDGTNTFTEPSIPDGTLIGSPAGTGTINYATGDLSITGGAASANVTGTLSYYPGLPVMGLRDYAYNASATSPPTTTIFPYLLAFDTTYSYQIVQTSSATNFYNVSYYKESSNPVTWSGQDYQQFWTTNYQGALWATNNNPGFQFETIDTISVGNPTTITTATPHGLVSGDYVFFNEITGTNANLLNLQTAEITVTSTTEFTVPINTTGKTINNSGIFQTLTATSQSGDGIRWYDGDQTSATGLPTSSGVGWVNFSPPLTAATVSIDDETAALYYLVGARLIVPYKDRLLFFSPWIQTSTGSAINLQDTVLWSWNGTPYYSSLTPVGETSDPRAYYQDQTGLGGNLPAGVGKPITTVGDNENALIVGFGGDGLKTRFVYTGNDLNPFNFYRINSELPSDSSFSTVVMDKGVLDLGAYGLTITDQQSCTRIDIQIPDEVFKIQRTNNGFDRVNAIRDFYKEWVYFSFPYDANTIIFPTRTLLYNYRDLTWAVFKENYTAHGIWRPTVKKSWLTTGFRSWNEWREPWNSGSTQPLFSNIIAGNPQGYVLRQGLGVGEAISGTISAIVASGSLPGNTQITSTNHCVELNDYLYLSGAISDTILTITGITQASQAVITATNTLSTGQYVQISDVSGMTQINGKMVEVVSSTGSTFTINLDTTLYSAYTSGGEAVVMLLQAQIGQVISIVDENNFVIDLTLVGSTYEGLGHYTRLTLPLLQTKQFPVFWEEGRQTRLSAQKYLLDKTTNGQITVNVYLSMDPTSSWNDPMINEPPNSLVYSQLMYTCPESTNIGLTSFNTNLQMPTANTQFQIWHRFNTSLIGDTVQIGFTLNDSQMRNLTYATSEISLHGVHLTVQKGPHLA